MKTELRKFSKREKLFKIVSHTIVRYNYTIKAKFSFRYHNSVRFFNFHISYKTLNI